MSLFGKILGTIGEVAIDAARISAHGDVFEAGSGSKRKKSKTCTPCEAMRRVEAASQNVHAVKRSFGGK